MFLLQFVMLLAKPPALIRGGSRRGTGGRRPSQRRKQEPPPPPIEATRWQLRVPKAERCVGGNLLAMRCRFATTEALYDVMGPALRSVRPEDILGWFRFCGWCGRPESGSPDSVHLTDCGPDPCCSLC